MNRHYMFLVLCIVLMTNGIHGIEPITSVSVATGLGLAGMYAGYEFLKCTMYECCSSQWIRPNITGLQLSFRNKLHGQHLVSSVVVRALQGHLRHPNPNKALVLSFHGWTGSGKNFVSKIIAEHLYEEGMHSKFVHLFVSTLHFPHKDMIKSYKDNLRSWIQGNISSCERSLFIFDEMDKMPEGLIDSVKPFIDYHDHVDRQNYRRSVFIFLSNTGGKAITKVAFDKWREGSDRNSITMKDIEDLIARGAFNEGGGLYRSDIIEKSLIDHYVPFLPLERHHIKMCVRDTLREERLRDDPSLINRVIDQLSFYPQDQQLYSRTGCKQILQKLRLVMDNEE